MLSGPTLDHQALDKHSLNHAAGRVGQSVAAARPLTDLLRNLHSTESGLITSDATDILKRIGPNRIDTAKRKSFVLALIERFTNPLVLILLFAAAVSAFTGDVPSFLIIAVSTTIFLRTLIRIDVNKFKAAIAATGVLSGLALQKSRTRVSILVSSSVLMSTCRPPSSRREMLAALT